MYPPHLQACRVTASTISGPTGASSALGPSMYLSYTQQVRGDYLTPRDREPCLVMSLDGSALTAGYYLCRLVGSYTDLPVYAAIPAAAGGSGITSINDDTTVSQTIGLGTAGTDINITTTAAAYSAGVTYSRGMIVSSGGATYRYSNATPSSGNAPPNATYWVVVTGDGLTIINVPDASTTADGLITTGTQTIVGFKTFQNAFGTRFTDGSGNGEIELGDPSTDGGAVGYGITLNRLVMTAVADTTYSVDCILYIGSQYTAWNSATAYVVGNSVSYQGYGYTCLVNNTNKVPNANPTEWQLQPSSYPPTDRPRLVLRGSNSADASSTTAGSKPIFEIEDAGVSKRGQWGTSGGGDTVSGGIITTFASPIVAADVSGTGPGTVIQDTAGAAFTVYQSSATGETTGFTAGAGTAVLDDSTFTGNVGSTAYNISDIVKALKGAKLLAD